MQRKIAWVLFLTLLVTSYSLLVTNTHAEEETLTITTYYPSPYGSYRELRAQRIAIGNEWYNGASACWDDENPATCSNPSNSTDVSLIVEGRVGIGTLAPAVKLDVNGGIRPGVMTSLACNSQMDGTIMRRFIVCGKGSEKAFYGLQACLCLRNSSHPEQTGDCGWYFINHSNPCD